MIKKYIKLTAGVLLASIVAAAAILTPSVSAEGNVSVAVSPPTQRVSLAPGETFNGSYKVFNKGDEGYNYKVEVTPYSVETEQYNPNYTTENNYNQIAKWTTIDGSSTGHIDPGEEVEVHFTIKVPEDAPGGAQYATLATSALDNQDGFMRTNTRVAMVFYAKIAGDTHEEGSIIENNLPSIVFGGNNLAATSLVENTGNVYVDAKYTMRVFPFGSSEEIYTNEEDPATRIVLPGTKCYNSLAWEDTPQLGLYTVEQEIEFMGQISTTRKLVIVCPVWLLVIFIALILAIIYTIVSRARARKQDRQNAAAHRGADRPAKKTEKSEKDD